MKAKKVVFGVLVLVVILVIAGSIGLYFSLNSLVKTGVEAVAPEATGSAVTLGKVKLMPFSGSGELQEFVIGNPKGFKTDYALRFGTIRVKVDPASLTSDCIVIKDVLIDGPQITYEQGLGGNNISALLANIQAFADKFKTESAEKESKPAKLRIDHFLLRNGKLRLSVTLAGGRTMDLPMPKVELKDIGGDDQSTWADTVSRLAGAINQAVVKAVTGSVGIVGDTGKEALNAAKGIGTGAKNTVKDLGSGVKDTATKTFSGVKNIFGRKKK